MADGFVEDGVMDEIQLVPIRFLQVVHGSPDFCFKGNGDIQSEKRQSLPTHYPIDHQIAGDLLAVGCQPNSWAMDHA